jgi:hypothetical protein
LGEVVCRQVQDELKSTPELLSGGVLRVQATERIIEHLLNRTRSRKSRIKKQQLMKNAEFGLT